MMVSMASAVLPVWRSPMMSSRWPRPIGTIASMDLRPVCTGWLTDWRAITPGAIFSIGLVSWVAIGPRPSIGWPSASTTRPISSGPTGTSRMRPVHFTASPSVMCLYSPRITAPTESRSRLSASPKVLPGNSSISPCMASARPCTRQMPSVRPTSVPSLRASACGANFSMRARISSLISDGLSCIVVPLLTGQRQAQPFELAAHRTVDHEIPGADHGTADEPGIGFTLECHFAVEPLLQGPGQRRAFFIAERAGRDHGRLDRALGIGAQLREHLRDHGQQTETAVLRQQPDEIRAAVAELLAHELDENLRNLLLRQFRAAEQRLHRGLAGARGRGRQHPRPGGQLLLCLRGLERRLGVGTGDGERLGHGLRFGPPARSGASGGSWRRSRVPESCRPRQWPRSRSRRAAVRARGASTARSRRGPRRSAVRPRRAPPPSLSLLFLPPP